MSLLLRLGPEEMLIYIYRYLHFIQRSYIPLISHFVPSQSITYIFIWRKLAYGTISIIKAT